jgi:mRNA interferase RelE/StbE
VACYRLLIKSPAARELEATPRKDRSRIVARIVGLAANPRPPGSTKLSGEEKYRLRQGDYRVLYSIQDDGMTVTIIKIGHRREVYRS